MKVAICDNEAVSLKLLEEAVGAFAQIEHYDLFQKIEDFFAKLNEGERYDVVFMDIEWGKENETGVNYASLMNKNYSDIQVIFVTSHNDIYSQHIFFEPVNLCGYLTKPVNPEFLETLIHKAEQKIKENTSKILSVKSNGQVEAIPICKILYAESQGHHVIIYKKDSAVSIYDKLDDIQKRLGNSFLRIHKSYCVNMDYIHKIDGRQVILSEGVVLPVSKPLMKETKELYLKYLRSQMKEA